MPAARSTNEKRPQANGDAKGDAASLRQICPSTFLDPMGAPEESKGTAQLDRVNDVKLEPQISVVRNFFIIYFFWFF